MSIHWFQMLSDQEIERLNEMTRKMHADMVAIEKDGPNAGKCTKCAKPKEAK